MVRGARGALFGAFVFFWETGGIRRILLFVFVLFECPPKGSQKGMEYVCVGPSRMDQVKD